MKDLMHPDDAKVLKALDRAREKGDVTWIRPLVEAFAARPDDPLREAMGELLGSLKLSAAEGMFLEMLEDPQWAGIKADLLGFLWSCGFTCPGHLALVARVACEGDFRQAMEGCTLVEQVETVDDERDLLEAITVVSQALQEGSPVSDWLEPMHAHLSMLNHHMD